MAIKTKVLQSGMCEITQEYKDGHGGIDLVREGYRLDNITAHSDGTVVQVIKNSNVNTPNEPTNPGNMVRIDHGNGFQTRYLHLAYGTVNVNGKVTAGGAVTAEKVILNVTGNEGVAIDAKGNVTLEGQINLGTGSVAGADVSLKAQNDLEFVKAGNITATGEVTVAGNAAAAEVNANVGTITGASAKVSYANTGAITATGDDGVSVMEIAAAAAVRKQRMPHKSGQRR